MQIAFMLTTLAELDKLVQVAFACEEHEATGKATTAVFEDLQKQVGLYERTFIDTFLAEISSIYQRERLEIYIEHIQFRCTALADKVYIHYTTFDKQKIGSVLAKQLITLYEGVLRICDSVLYYIETHFSRYFNVERQLPAHYYARYKRQLHKQIKQLKVKLEKLAEDSVLIQISLRPIEDFIQPLPNVSFSYRYLIYIRKLIEQLNHVGAATSVVYYTSLERCLIEMNFNSRDFLAYFIERQRRAALAIEEVAEQRCFWLGLQKALNQLLTVFGTVYLPEHASVHSVLNRIVDDELYFLSEHSQWKGVVKPERGNVVKPVFQVSMPVSQLAFLLRLLVDAGVIKTQNQTAFLKEVALLVATDRAGVISAESLRNKYYAPERTTMGAVKDLLFDLIKRTHGLG